MLADLGYAPWGLDASPLLLARAGRRVPAARLVLADARRPPFAPGRFRLVLAECLLSLLPHPGEALRAWRELLAPEGRMIISDLYLQNPPPASLFSPLPPASCLEGAVSREESLARLEAAGKMRRRPWR